MRLLPPLTAVLLIALFVSLGFWQLDRAAEKVALQEMFANAETTAEVTADLEVTPYQAISSDGRYLNEQQFLIDNIILDGRIGYYVISPFQYADGQPLLLVNRGWIEKSREPDWQPAIGLSAESLAIRGRAGRLPRVGVRPGEAFEGPPGWPRVGIYPDYADIAAELDHDVLPFVLLLEPDHGQDMLRDWQPRQAGPRMHYGYAFQWFALSAAVLVLLFWYTRKSKGRAGKD